MGPDRQLNIKAFCFNSFRENCFVIWDAAGDCVIIDPGCYRDGEVRKLKDFIASEGLAPKAIWLTHGHFDHIFGVAELSRTYSLPVLMAPGDKEIVAMDVEFASGVGLDGPDTGFSTSDLHDGDLLDTLADAPFAVIATPGHSPGSVCFYCESRKALFSGDTLFAGAIGRTDIHGGDYDKEIVSIMDKLMGLPGDVDVFPGHGPATSIADERTHNPFLQPWGEPWEEDYI